MAPATLPSLSMSEHIRFGVAQFASLFVANVAYLLIFGPGWSGLAAFVMAALAIFVASEAIVRWWGRRQGRLLVTRKEWDDARQAAQQTWTLKPIHGFVFGFAVMGGSLEAANWGQRIFGGVVCAAVWVMFAPPRSRLRDQQDQPVSNTDKLER